MPASDWDGQIAQLVPQNIEKIPLYHWRPGIRLLAVGSRDGAAFDDDIERAEANTFHRPLTPELLKLSQEKMSTQGLCMNMSNSLAFPKNVECVTQSVDGALVLATSGYGDASLVDSLADKLDALLVLIHEITDLTQTLLTGLCHTEVLIGIDQNVPALDLPWQNISAVHLCSLRPMHNADQRQEWYASARAAIPQYVPLYDEDHMHSYCQCGAVLVWRSGGRSRLDALDAETSRCSSCGKPSTLVL